jgi:TPR repeat protein
LTAHFFQIAADLNNGSFDGVSCANQRAIRYSEIAASLSDADGLYNFARCLEYGICVDQDFIKAAKYYRLAVFSGTAKL